MPSSAIRADMRTAPTAVVPIFELLDGEKCCVHATVGAQPKTAHIRKGMDVTNCRVYDETGLLSLRFFNNKYAASVLEVGNEYAFYGKVQAEGRQFVMIAPEFEPVQAKEKTGRILPLYPLTAGLHRTDLYKITDAALAALPENYPDFLPEAIRKQQQIPSTGASPAQHAPPHKPSNRHSRRASAWHLKNCFCLPAA